MSYFNIYFYKTKFSLKSNIILKFLNFLFFKNDCKHLKMKNIMILVIFTLATGIRKQTFSIYNTIG